MTKKSDKEKQEKLIQLYAYVSQAKDALKQAQDYADEHGLSFKWDSTYGNRNQEYLGRGFRYDFYRFDNDDEKILSEGKWVSSSDGC